MNGAPFFNFSKRKFNVLIMIIPHLMPFKLECNKRICKKYEKNCLNTEIMAININLPGRV